MADKDQSADVTADEAPVAKKTAKKAPAKASSEKAPAKAAAKVPAKKAAAAEATAGSASEAAGTTAAKKPVAKKAPAKGSNTREGAGGTLKVHHLRPAPGAHTAKTRVGRGEAGARGKTAGRGTKGTKARYQVPDRFEGGQMPLHMRLPKLRGFKNPFRTEYQVVNLATLAELYPKGGEVTSADLVAKGAVRKGQLVKVLGDGDVSVKLRVSVDAYSASAKEKIVAAGGTINED